MQKCKDLDRADSCSLLFFKLVSQRLSAIKTQELKCYTGCTNQNAILVLKALFKFIIIADSHIIPIECVAPHNPNQTNPSEHVTDTSNSHNHFWWQTTHISAG